MATICSWAIPSACNLSPCQGQLLIRANGRSTYGCILHELEVEVGEVFAVQVTVDTLSFLAFAQFFTDQTSFHRVHP